MMLGTLERLFLWFIGYSIAGWTYESILVSAVSRRWVNRGFLNGPLCPIYGVGAVLAVLLLGGIANPVVVFLAAAGGASALEYVTSWAMEQLFHARWWDYSRRRFNIQGRVCLLGAVVFGAAGVLIVKVAQPVVAGLTQTIPPAVLHAVCAVCAALLVADIVVTIRGMAGFEENLDKLKAMIQEYASRAGESLPVWDGPTLTRRMRAWSKSSQETFSRLRDAAMGVLSAQQRRMIDAFPRLTSTTSSTYDSLIETVRHLIDRNGGDAADGDNR